MAALAGDMLMCAIPLLVLAEGVAVGNPESIPLTEELIDMLGDDKKYNRFATPSQWQGVPTNVAVQMYIEGLSAFSARTMDFQMDIYFQQEWIDPRLRHNNSERVLMRDKATLERMWHPDLYFANAKRADFQTVTADNFLVWIYANGTIFYDARISLTVICEMNLSKYPLDSQECDLRILSYAYDDTQLNVTWAHEEHHLNVGMNPTIRMPDMHLVAITTDLCDGTYATGVWSCINATLWVRREIMHHVMQTYLPSGLIVVISWFSFWLDVDAAPARVSLSITTLLTIATQANAVKMELPEVSYMKAIDVWMGVCMTFVFGVMIEFTVCHFARNRIEEAPAVGKGGLVSLAGAINIATSAGLSSCHTMSPTTDVKEDVRIVKYNELQQRAVEEEKVRQGERRRTCDVRVTYDGNSTVNSIVDPPNGRTSMSSYAQSLRRTALKQVTQNTERWLRGLQQMKGRKAAVSIDEKCRWLFPLVFLVFNMTYWLYYTVIKQ